MSAVLALKAHPHYPNANRCNEIKWETIASQTLKEANNNKIYDKATGADRQLVDIDQLPLLNTNNEEIHVFDLQGERINRRAPDVNTDDPCGVMINLENIQTLFSLGAPRLLDDDYDSDDDFPTAHPQPTKVQVYPLGFLRTVGNLQATGPPNCLYPTLSRINKAVREPLRRPVYGSDDGLSFEDDRTPGARAAPVVTAIASQFYNLVAHRAAPRAGRLDSQQGLVTAALAGAFAQTTKDKNTAWEMKQACKDGLPSERFHSRIHSPNCPKSCRAEVVYTVDVRKLKSKCGRHEMFWSLAPEQLMICPRFIFDEIILPLARAWVEKEVLDAIKQHLVIFKPQVSSVLW